MTNFNTNISMGNTLKICVLSVFFTSCNYVDTNPQNEDTMKNNKEMPTFVIEREIENSGSLTAEELRAASKKSNAVIEELGSDIQWKRSYVVDNKQYCVYKARDKALIKQHAEKVGVPANSISEVSAIIDPSTAE